MLIFENGTAYFDEPDKQKGDWDIDADGMPIEGGELTIEVPCFIEVSNENKRGRYDDGAHTNGSYTISLDYGSIDTDTFKPSKVRLQHKRKGDLGEFTIQRIEFFDITRTVQVWV